MQKKHQQEGFDDSFYELAANVATVIAKNKKDHPEYDGLNSTEAQKRQVEELLDAEKKFKENVLKYRQSTEIYKKFLQKVCIKNRNILSARPYFRETATRFSKNITPAIKSSNIEVLKTFDVNYQFIKFVRDNWLGKFPPRAQELFDRVHAGRQLLIENNMPLAINRAKLFWRKTPRSHLTLVDLIGISAMGLAAGVDKWCGPYSPVFRSVCIGRMVGNMIDSYSETLLHFYPSDKRILYKANSIRGRKGVDAYDDLAEAVNNAFQEDAKDTVQKDGSIKKGKSIPKNKVKVGELSELMQAASTVSADTSVSTGGKNDGTTSQPFTVYDYTADSSVDTEQDFIDVEQTSKMLALSLKLPILNRKLLRLKGVKL
jgi:hypothetical protein